MSQESSQPPPPLTRKQRLKLYGQQVLACMDVIGGILLIACFANAKGDTRFASMHLAAGVLMLISSVLILSRQQAAYWFAGFIHLLAIGEVLANPAHIDPVTWICPLICAGTMFVLIFLFQLANAIKATDKPFAAHALPPEDEASSVGWDEAAGPPDALPDVDRESRPDPPLRRPQSPPQDDLDPPEL